MKLILGNFVFTLGNLRTRYMDPYFKSHFAILYDPTEKYGVSKTDNCPYSLGQIGNCHRLTNRTNYPFLGADISIIQRCSSTSSKMDFLPFLLDEETCTKHQVFSNYQRPITGYKEACRNKFLRDIMKSGM